MARRYLKDDEVAIGFERWGRIQAALKESGWAESTSADQIVHRHYEDTHGQQAFRDGIASVNVKVPVYDAINRVILALGVGDVYFTPGDGYNKPAAKFLDDIELIIRDDSADAARKRIRPTAEPTNQGVATK